MTTTKIFQSKEFKSYTHYNKLVECLILNIVLVVLFSGFLWNNSYATIATSITSGDWSNTSTWDCTCVPASTDSVIIASGHTVTLDGNITLKNLTIKTGGTLDVDIVNDYAISISGAWIDSGAFNEHQGSVIFNGTAAQSITTSDGERFYNLEINNSSGIIMQDSVMIITNILTLTIGNIVLGANILEMDTNSSIAGSPGVSSYIQADGTGVMRKFFTTTGSFTFPVGDIDEYSPLIFDLNSATFGGDDFIAVRVTDAKHPNMTLVNYITRYWTLKSGGFPAINYDITYFYLQIDVVGTESDLYTKKYNSSTWTSYDAVNAATNMATSSSGITAKPNNHTFTAGGANPLPIELLNFSAKPYNNVVEIIWSTATEVDNAYFSLERSANSSDFEVIQTVKGAGNSYTQLDYSVIDEIPLPGTSYYRLKQTDFNGNYFYSPMVSVDFKNSLGPEFKVFPNPSTGENITISMIGATEEELEILIYNSVGVMVYSDVIEFNNGIVSSNINLSNKFAPGNYFVIGQTRKEIFKKKLIIIHTSQFN